MEKSVFKTFKLADSHTMEILFSFGLALIEGSAGYHQNLGK
jgi:hypothetical protein